jgi:hypothetical protein
VQAPQPRTAIFGPVTSAIGDRDTGLQEQAELPAGNKESQVKDVATSKTAQDQHDDLASSSARRDAPRDLEAEQQAQVDATREAARIAAEEELSRREQQYWTALHELQNHRETYDTQYDEFFSAHPNDTVDYCRDTFGPMHLYEAIILSKRVSKAEKAMKAARVEARKAEVEQPNSYDQEYNFLTAAGEGEPIIKQHAQFSMDTCNTKRIREWPTFKESMLRLSGEADHVLVFWCNFLNLSSTSYLSYIVDTSCHVNRPCGWPFQRPARQNNTILFSHCIFHTATKQVPD